MSSREFAEWAAYYALEPWGEERADVRSAMICKVLADLNTPKDQPRHPLEDFMPKFGGNIQTEEEMLAHVATLNGLFGGQDLREGGE